MSSVAPAAAAAPFISIQLNSNRPAQIVRFFDSIEATAAHPEAIEVLLHIDEGDGAMEEAAAREQVRCRFALRVLKTDLVKSYRDLWKPLNPLLKMTNPDAYFIFNTSDEILFATRHWDVLLRPYVGYFPDHIFRLRTSQYRFRNYTDFWQCGFAPDGLAFYTRRWMELSEDWCPCLGPDSFQQCVAFYLSRSRDETRWQPGRDVPLREFQFSGEGVSLGLEGEALYRRNVHNNKAWFVLMSARMQEEANRRAMRMKSHSIAEENADSNVVEDRARKQFIIQSGASPHICRKISYRLPLWRLQLTNLLRIPMILYYGGGGGWTWNTCLRSLILMLVVFLPFTKRPLLGAFEGYYRLRYGGTPPVPPPVKKDPGALVVFNAFNNTGMKPADAAVTEIPTVFSFQCAEGAPGAAFAGFLDHIERTAAAPQLVEILAPLDAEDTAAAQWFMHEQPKRKLKLRPIVCAKSKDAIHIRDALFAQVNPQAFFIAFADTGLRFETLKWDELMMGYFHMTSDFIFRLRASDRRHHNYAAPEDCVSVPERAVFYSQRWLTIQGGAGPAEDTEAFQQCVAWHLAMSPEFSHLQDFRDFPVPFLRVIPASSLPAHEKNRAALLSAEMQENARFRAMQLKAAILYHAALTRLPDHPLILGADTAAKRIQALSTSGELVREWKYG